MNRLSIWIPVLLAVKFNVNAKKCPNFCKPLTDNVIRQEWRSSPLAGASDSGSSSDGVNVAVGAGEEDG